MQPRPEGKKAQQEPAYVPRVFGPPPLASEIDCIHCAETPSWRGIRGLITTLRVRVVRYLAHFWLILAQVSRPLLFQRKIPQVGDGDAFSKLMFNRFSRWFTKNQWGLVSLVFEICGHCIASVLVAIQLLKASHVDLARVARQGPEYTTMVYHGAHLHHGNLGPGVV